MNSNPDAGVERLGQLIGFSPFTSCASSETESGVHDSRLAPRIRGEVQGREDDSHDGRKDGDDGKSDVRRFHTVLLPTLGFPPPGTEHSGRQFTLFSREFVILATKW